MATLTQTGTAERNGGGWGNAYERVKSWLQEFLP
jgi:hypothetical protein